jgi:hypothetical protein
MTREFVELPEFIKCWHDLGLSEDDLLELELYLCKNPEKGDVIQGTGGLRKIRWKIRDKGKSGGVRALYIDFASYRKLYLITVYTKSEKENITDEDKKQIKHMIGMLRNELERKASL